MKIGNTSGHSQPSSVPVKRASSSRRTLERIRSWCRTTVAGKRTSPPSTVVTRGGSEVRQGLASRVDSEVDVIGRGERGSAARSGREREGTADGRYTA